MLKTLSFGDHHLGFWIDM